MFCRLAFAQGPGPGIIGTPTPTPGGTLTTIHTFLTRSEGSIPLSEVTQGADGFLYGTTSTGGPNNAGTLWRCQLNGANFGVLHAFGSSATDGRNPFAGVFQGQDGNFYGTTQGGGINNQGVLYRFSSPDSPQGLNYTILQFFNAASIGSNPEATLAEDPDGFLYGTATAGGTQNAGSVFRLGLDGDLVRQSIFQGRDSSDPNTALVFYPTDRLMYGTTANNNSNAGSVIYKVSTNGNGERANVFQFPGGTIGYEPNALSIGPNNQYLYGTTRAGGISTVGAFYRFNPSQIPTQDAVTLLYTFTPAGGLGFIPVGKLLLASDSNFYGAANSGGNFNSGAIFQITPNGFYTTIFNFPGGLQVNGGSPQAGLILGSDGNMYGTTAGINTQPSTLYQLAFNLPPPLPVVDKFTLNDASAGESVGVIGDYFVGARNVNFIGPTNPDGSPGLSVGAPQFQVLSKNFLTVVVPSNVAPGLNQIQVIGPSSTQVGTSTNTIHIASTALPILKVKALQSATSNGAPPAILKLKRVGNTDLNQPFTVKFKFKPETTAQLNVDFQLDPRYFVSPDEFVIPAGVKKINATITFIPTSPAPVGTNQKFIWIKIKGNKQLYQIPGPKKVEFILNY